MTDSKAPWLARGSAIALMMAAGIALAACGGGGGLNEDESAGIQQQLEDAQAQATADAAARVTAEAEAAAAETAKETAEAEKLKAEAEKAAADTARDVAVAEAAAAEMAKATAEAEKAKAETEKAAADAAREVAVAEAAAAETARLAAVAETAAAETARELAVAAKKTAEAEAAAARAATETAVAEAAEARTAQQAAETAKDAAEAAQRLAEDNADAQVALAETAKMEARDADAAVVQANAALTVAQDEQKAAEDERDVAIAARDEAQRQLGLALAATTAEERRRQEAEAEQDRLEQVAEDAQQQVTRADARQVREGLAATIGIADSGFVDPMVTPKYNAAADVSGTGGSFSNSNPTTGSLSGWFKTAFVKSTRDQIDRLEIYSNVEAVKSIRFRDSDYNDGTADDADIPNTGVVGPYDGTPVDHDDNAGTPNVVISPEGMIINWLSIPADIGRKDAVASPFPRESGTESYTLNDRGISEFDFLGIDTSATDYNGDDVHDRDDIRRLLEGYTDDENMVVEGYTDEQLDTTADGLDITRQELSRYIRGASFRDTTRYPQRYEYETRGSLGGASGTFRCGGNTQVTCSVRRTGSELEFPAPGPGTWTFRPSSASVSVRVEDSEYMYFGWWSRQNTGTGSWEFKAFHGPGGTDGHRVTDVTGVTGSAEYQGPAAGYYAIYEPASAGSEHGAFTATATLTADFDASPNTVSGTIDQFSGHADWSLSLEQANITGGNVVPTDNSVIWTIGDDPAAAGGSWEASFYSNLAPEDPPVVDLVPSGIAGTFRATYDQVGSLIGAFGAECETGC